MKNRKQTTLIVGAGPTGMIMAIQLAKKGVPIRIIDRISKPATTSRAFTVHARTLELLEQMNLISDFLEKGIRTNYMDYHFQNYTNTPRLDFTELDSTYPFMLTINQTETENILRNHLNLLGIKIEWNTELVSFEEQNETISTKLVHTTDQKEEIVEVDWLIGCDGYHSAVRKGLNISLDGSDYEGTMRMMDVPMHGFEEIEDAIHYFMAKDHMLMINKLPDNNYRVLISDKTEGVPPEEAKEAFQKTLHFHFKEKVTLGEPVWATNFRISKRKVNSYRVGNVFLAGDAAHINSPAGGQGMNVAMQDAFNLGWKLALVANGEANSTLLETYEEERKPIAKQLLEGTSYIHSIIMAHSKGMEERIERMKSGEWNKQAVSQISGLSYTYSDNSDSYLGIGDRAPDDFYTDSDKIYDLFANDKYTLLLFETAEKSLDELSKIAQNIKTEQNVPLQIYLITPSSAHQASDIDIIHDAKGIISARYVNDTNDHIFLIRPDTYIGFKGEELNDLYTYFEPFFLEAVL